MTPVSKKWDWQHGGFFLGNADGTSAIILEPGIYEISLPGIVFQGTDERAREAQEWNSQFRIAVGWYTRAPG